jgi:hypothetical protein
VFLKNQEAILKQKFNLNRDDFLVRANNLDAHYGYDLWHREYGRKVFELIENSKSIRVLRKGLNKLYSSQLMIEKFGQVIFTLLP